MSELDLESRLTHAAREVLDESVAEYRTRILLRAHGHAASLGGEVREISVRDIILAAKDSPFGIPLRLLRLRRIGLLYAMIGISMAGIGTAMFLFRYIADNEMLRSTNILPLAVGISGAFVGAFGLLLTRKYEERIREQAEEDYSGTPDHFEASGRFLARWGELEVVLRSVVAERLGESVAGEPLSRLIYVAASTGLLNSDSVLQLRMILDMRNNLVHGGAQFTSLDLIHASKQLSSILRGLQGAREHRVEMPRRNV